MLRLKKTMVGILAAAFAVSAFASASQAVPRAVINPTALGAAVALPYLTSATGGGERITVATVTNGAADARNLHMYFINGSNWSAINKDCPLTPWETTYLVFERNGSGAKVTYECSSIGQEFPDPSATNNVFTATGLGADGILFIAQECQLGSGPNCTKLNERTRNDDVLNADATVLDFGQGLAFSVSGVHIQGVANGVANGDRFYAFNSAAGEYRTFPSMLSTNYIAPDASITAEVILFTLDGRVNGGPGVNASVSGDAYDDDENPTSGGINFDCFTVADISADPPQGWGTNVTREVSGGLVGHLELDVNTALRSDIHELTPAPNGGGDPAALNFARFANVHGWLVQTIAAGGQLNGGNTPPMSNPSMAGNAAWARLLSQGTLPLAPLGGDVTALDGR